LKSEEYLYKKINKYFTLNVYKIIFTLGGNKVQKFVYLVLNLYFKFAILSFEIAILNTHIHACAYTHTHMHTYTHMDIVFVLIDIDRYRSIFF